LENGNLKINALPYCEKGKRGESSYLNLKNCIIYPDFFSFAYRIYRKKKSVGQLVIEYFFYLCTALPARAA
jgi:hypothetical protein